MSVGLAQRIGALLVHLGQREREPNRLELHCLLDALSHLQEGDWALGEQAVDAAERAAAATPEQISAVPAPVDPVTLAVLRRRMDLIVGASLRSRAAARPRSLSRSLSRSWALEGT